MTDTMSNTNTKKLLTTRNMVAIAMMSTIATVIYYLDFPVPLMPGFIKLDLSNVISLLAGFSMGPVAGVIVCLIKNLVQLLRLCYQRLFCSCCRFDL